MAVTARRLLHVDPRPVGFRRLLVPVSDPASAVSATAVACRLAADRKASLTLVAVIEVPPELPLDALMTEEEERARELLRLARAEADRFGVTNAIELLRGRDAGEAVVEAARSSPTDLVVLAAARRRRPGRHGPVFTREVATVLEHAPCRVLVTAPPPR
jgi:nucleotide-binding universal stress UspA family protein